MRNFNENTITDAVLERIAGATDPRIKEVSEALVRHLHAFIREVRPTQKEWEYGIDFLTRTGHMCDDKRQEFILLSDTLGVSMLVDAINHCSQTAPPKPPCLGRSSYRPRRRSKAVTISPARWRATRCW